MFVVIIFCLQDHNKTMTSSTRHHYFSPTRSQHYDVEHQSYLSSFSFYRHHLLFLSFSFATKKRTVSSLSSFATMHKIRKEEEKGAYLQAPTFATILTILLFSHSCYHHIEAPRVGAFLKLLALEGPLDFTFLKL